MMVPFDGSGPPQPVQQGVAPSMQRQQMQSGHVQAPSPVMPPGHHQPMNPPYGHHHRGGGVMPGQPPYMQNPSPARQGNYAGMPGSSQYSSHPALHSPHQSQGGPSMHPSMQRPSQPLHRQPLGRTHSAMGQGISSMQGMDPMRPPSAQGAMSMQQQQAYRQQQQQQQQGRGSGSSNMNYNWRGDADEAIRRKMIQQIVRLLEKDKQTSPDSASKMPQMAKQLEVSLYREAPSKEAYLDTSTLKQRLQLIAQEVAKKSQNRAMNGSTNYSHQSQPQPPQQSQTHQLPQQSSQQQVYNNSNNKMMRQDINGTASPYMSTSNNSSAGPMVCMDDINPMAQGNGYPMGSTNHRNQRLPSASAGVPSNNNNRSNNDDMKVKHKQQRLLLLHHSAKCTNDTNCPITQHCAEMRRLWRHMEGCKDNRCEVAHCFSSRAILSHYRKCKNNSCPACVPVKDAVRKSRTNTSRMSGSGAMMDRLRGNTPNQGLSQSIPSDPLGTSTGVPYTSSLPTGAANNAPNGRGPIPRSAMPPPAIQPNHNSLYNVNASQPQVHPQGQNQQQPTSNGPSGRSASSSQSSQPAFRQERNADVRTNSSRANRDEPNGSDRTRSNVDRTEPEDLKIRHKVQRLLLLRHANKCKYTSDCPATPHCASMKRLWTHISDCKDQSCQFAHCMSSRYVLSHYRRCQDPLCPACAPVRESINRADQGDRRKAGGRTSLDSSANGNDAIGPSSSSPPPFFVAGDSLQPIGPTSSNHQLLSSPHSQQASPTGEPETKRIKTEPTMSIADEGGFNPPLPARSSSTPPQAVQSNHEIAQEAPPSAERVAAPPKSATHENTKLSVDNSLLNSFTVKQLETHLASLDRKTQLPPAKLKTKCTEVLKGMQTHQHGWVFNSPVDPVELGLPDYFDIIKKPMDLGTVQKRLENGFYHSIDEFAIDVNLTFDNATTYNENGSVVYNMATELKTKFCLDLRKLYDQLEAEDRIRRQNERACTLCGCEKLNFEPPVYFCNGMNCQSQRIRRNSHFYIGGNNQYFWCVACYNELDDKRPIELVDMTIQKADLKKKKNDEQHEESWVQCDFCNSWVHQICGLFNTRQNKEHQSEYCCPKCLLHKRRTTDVTPCVRTLSAADLPRTILSEWLEQNISKKVEAKKKELTSGKSESENTSLEDALQYVEAGGPIYIRQVTSMERKLEVRELMRARYEHKNYPEEFPFRCKCIVVFQELDGVDVVLFALYVYEHGEDNPPPNQRVVYISYLDSVHFMRPRNMRTFVYHEILIAYLDYARRRGFATAHIWACPPLKGDDYIFFAKPEDQKTPRDGRLRQWYIDMLTDCQKRNIVGKVTNMYDLYFANETLDATVVPYLEGDYFPGEAENIIKMLSEGGGKKGGAAGKKKKSKATNKSKGNTGTRSTGMDEQALLDSGMLNVKDLDRDQVMAKLGETIQPMKDSFIVAFLNWAGAKEEDMVVPKEIEEARIEYASALKVDVDTVGNKRDLSGSVKDIIARGCVDRNGKDVKVIDDDAEDMDCEILNNRQAFLNLCRGNHYQFDEVRRAKHTSIMVLWHLHNRDAPKFVQQCFSCSREILSGRRYHCNTCTEFDLCQVCYDDPNSNRGSCTHELVPIAVDPDASKERSNLSEAERKKRQRSVLLHVQLIEHAARCKFDKCPSRNCPKMKEFLRHASTCSVKVQGGCKTCKRIWTLLRIHAQKCKDSSCQIPQCMAIKEKMRQLQKQQQAMDDRRRIEMNRHMRFGATVERSKVKCQNY